MRKFLISIALAFVAMLLFVLLVPFGIIWGLGASFFRAKFKEAVDKLSIYFMTIAVSIDQSGNVFCKELFNDVLIKPKGNQFGDEDETISSVLGRNKLAGTLTWAGQALDWVLDKLDKNHSIKSIEK